MEADLAEKRERRKRKIRLLAGLFVLAMALFTLIGNTLQGLTLPRVATVVPETGQLAHSFEGTAALQPAEERDLFGPAGRKALQVLVREGDVVRKGQTLVTYDDGDAAMQAADAEAALQKLQLSMEGLQKNFIEAEKSDDEAAKTAAMIAIESAKLDIASQQRSLDRLRDEREENRKLVAPFDGVVVSVGAAEGLASGGAADVRLTNAAKGFRFALQLPGDVAALLDVGEELEIESGKSKAAVIGRVANLESGEAQSGGTGMTAQGATRMTVTLSGESLRGGDKVHLRIDKPGNAEAAMLLARDAVHQDGAGAYVFTVVERQGALGNAYYAVRRPVTIVDANESTVAVTGLFEAPEVVMTSSEPLFDGDRVRP